MAYEQAKAEAYNKARAQGLSQAEALTAAGIAGADRFSYATGPNGQIGPREQIVANLGQAQGSVSAPTDGSTDSQGRPVQVLSGQAAAQARAEEAAFEQTGRVPVTPYAQTASPAPGTITRREYTETSTTAISGGGSTTIVATPAKATPASQALDAQAQQTQREIEALQLANSGLGDGPQLTEQQMAANDAKILQLQQQYNTQRDAAEAAKVPSPPSITTVPNTTTTINTVAYERGVEVTPVNASDPAQTVRATEAGVTTTVARTVEVTPAVAETPISRSFNDVNAKDDEANTRARVAAYLRGDPDIVLTPEEERYLEQQSQQINRQNSAVYDQAPPVNPNTDDALRTPGGAIEGGVQAETGLAEPPNVDSNEDPGVATGGATGDDLAIAFDAGPVPVDGTATGADLDIAYQADPVPPSQAGPIGTAYDDDGFLNPGYTLDEDNNPVFVGGDFVEPATAESAAASREAAIRAQAKKQATVQARYKQTANKDWRVRLSLGPGAQYLYNATPAGVLAPLSATNGTDGVIFPYTPTISTNYSANYEQYDLIHSNYRGIFYKSSRVGDITIRGMFTAQDTTEANYLLAVIHFFRSVTKMFYGQDTDLRGTPPPICLLNGYGGYQFSNHPVVVSSFDYTLPNDVDYIRTTNPNNFGLNLNNRYNPAGASLPAGGALAGLNRLLNAIPGGLSKGALPKTPAPNTVAGSVTNNVPASYVPTKMEVDIKLIPVQSRSQVSQQFSLKGFANGDLLKGGFW